MRASSTFAFGAAAALAASFISLAPAYADPAYSSENVVQIFLKQKGALTGGKTRALCVGTAADCKKQEAAEAPPPVQFDLLANFEFNSERADAGGAGKPGPVRQGDQRSAARRLEIRDRRPHRRHRTRRL